MRRKPGARAASRADFIIADYGLISTNYKVLCSVAVRLFVSGEGAIISHYCRALLSYAEGLGVRPGAQVRGAKGTLAKPHSHSACVSDS